MLFICITFLILDLIYLLSLDESDSLDDDSDNESNDDGSDSGSASTFTFTFRFEEFVGYVCGVGSGVFVPIGIKSIGEVVTFVVFVPLLSEAKGGRLIETIWRSIY